MARRNRKIDLRLNDTEFERLNNDVQKTGLSREEYLRSLIKHSRTLRSKTRNLSMCIKLHRRKRKKEAPVHFHGIV